CTLLLAAAGLKLVRRARAPRRAWNWFAGALLAALLARYVNLWLMLVVPVTFALLALHAQLRALFARARESWQRRPRAILRRAAIATAIGVVCIFTADLSARTVCKLNKLQFHSLMGHTFLWRLQFLADMPKPERDNLFDRVNAHVRSPDAGRVLGLMREMFDRGDRLSAAAVEKEGLALIRTPKTRGGRVIIDAALNSMAWSFLLPPAPELLHVARLDFARAQQVALSDIASSLFATTAYYFDHPAWMQQCANLVTFRDTTADALRTMPTQHRYFQIARGLTFKIALTIWFAALLAFAFASQYMRRSRPEIVCYAVSLTLVGLLMVASSCLLGELLPRYTLPMWELLSISLLTVVGSGLELIGRRRRATRTAPARSSGKR
ncbi:MAG: hypothetical protein M3032_09370, partial [Verrucomicrobiota bacterium]|nr:hypothetical protein [Verrucomicrobiota bacterium]